MIDYEYERLVAQCIEFALRDGRVVTEYRAPHFYALSAHWYGRESPSWHYAGPTGGWLSAAVDATIVLGQMKRRACDCGELLQRRDGMRLCVGCGGAYDDKPFFSQRDLARRGATEFRADGFWDPLRRVEDEIVAGLLGRLGAG